MKPKSLVKTLAATSIIALLVACASPSPGVYTRSQPTYTDYLIVPIAKNHYSDIYTATTKHTNKHRIALLYGQQATVTLKVTEGTAHIALSGKGFDKTIVSTKNNNYVWKLKSFRSNTFAVIEAQGDDNPIEYTVDVKIQAGDQLENLK